MSVIIEKELSNQVLGAVFAVHNLLGLGLVELAYEGALVIEFKHLGLNISRQHVYPVYYRGDDSRCCSSMSVTVFVHPCTALNPGRYLQGTFEEKTPGPPADGRRGYIYRICFDKASFDFFAILYYYL